MFTYLVYTKVSFFSGKSPLRPTTLYIWRENDNMQYKLIRKEGKIKVNYLQSSLFILLTSTSSFSTSIYCILHRWINEDVKVDGAPGSIGEYAAGTLKILCKIRHENHLFSHTNR